MKFTLTVDLTEDMINEIINHRDIDCHEKEFKEALTVAISGLEDRLRYNLINEITWCSGSLRDDFYQKLKEIEDSKIPPTPQLNEETDGIDIPF